MLQRVSDTPPYLSVAPMVLDVRGHMLHGPAGRVVLERGAYQALKVLFQRPGAAVPRADLIEESWPDCDVEPANPEQALCMRIIRARAAMQRVGVPGQRLRSVRGLGYLLEGEPRVVRTFTVEQAARLDALLAQHPEFGPHPNPNEHTAREAA